MTTIPESTSARIRGQLDHPVIDADGHMVEFLPPIEDYVKRIGGSDYAVRYSPPALRYPAQTDADRRKAASARPPWWVVLTKNTLDRATVALPKLLAERMPEFGLDYLVLFPTTIGYEVYRKGASRGDPETQRVSMRAVNAYRMDLCREYADRMTPVAGIRMATPEQAIEDLEYAVGELGYKTVSIRWSLRPVQRVEPEKQDAYTSLFSLTGGWLDSYGLDSDYDYDPFWSRCIELGVPVLSHGNGQGFTTHNSPSNHTYNHIGNFGAAGEAMCKALFLGGVTRRFPKLRVAFLEGGVAWACRLYSDLFGRWEKRNRVAIENMNPANLDRELFVELHKQYGPELIEGRLDQLLSVGPGLQEETIVDPADLDDFRACGIQRREDLRDLFIPNFFFGCEADDPTNAWAFNAKVNPLGARLNALFSSDMGHWDVPNIRDVVAEAYESVERGLMTSDDFRDFTFTNPVKLFAGANPNFFQGTAFEKQAAEALAGG